VKAPAQVYRLTAGDERSVTIETINRETGVTASATTINNEFTSLANDRIFVLTNISGILLPGAAQGVASVTCSVFTASGAGVDVFRLVYPATADLDETFNWQGEVWVRGRGGTDRVFQVQAKFSAAVAANTNNMAFSGYIIPRANVAEY